jgi:hypothetical protein
MRELQSDQDSETLPGWTPFTGFVSMLRESKMWRRPHRLRHGLAGVALDLHSRDVTAYQVQMPVACAVCVLCYILFLCNSITKHRFIGLVATSRLLFRFTVLHCSASLPSEGQDQTPGTDLTSHSQTDTFKGPLEAGRSCLHSDEMANYGGEAANYYNQQPPPPPNAYQKHPPPQTDYNNGPANGGHYAPPPYPPPQSEPKGPPPSYDEVFAIQKPKWNDVWAGLLFLATCAGFVVVSAISIQGYGEHTSSITALCQSC